MLLTKASAVSNVENRATGPKIADLHFGQEAQCSHQFYNHNPLPRPWSLTTCQQESGQANQLASIEGDLAQVQEIAETFEEESGLPVCEMVGLRANIEFKESINAIIENGYKLPFATLPEPVKLRKNKSARLNAGFVDQAIYDLVLFGRIG